MSKGEFSRREIEEILIIVESLSEAIPKKRKFMYLGHLEYIYAFLDAAREFTPK